MSPQKLGKTLCLQGLYSQYLDSLDSSESLRNHSTQTIINDIITVRSRDLRKYQEAFSFIMFSGGSKGNIGKKRVKDENYTELQGELEFLTCI